MALSEKRKKQLKKAVIEGKETEEYLIKEEEALGRGTIDQAWHIVLTYLSTEDLVKHSKRLTWFTIGLLFATILLFGTAIAPIICSRIG